MKVEILRLLRETDGYVSGQELCNRFGVSRTARWKVINQLKDKGYEIENIFNANEGVYILLVLKDKYKYATNSDSSNHSYTLIEEEKKKGVPTWVTSITNQVKNN